MHIQATDPRGQDADTRSEDSDLCPKIGKEKCYDILSSIAPMVFAAWRVFEGIDLIVSAGKEISGETGSFKILELNAVIVKCNPELWQVARYGQRPVSVCK